MLHEYSITQDITLIIYFVVITLQSNPPISKFSQLCNEFTGVWSMFPCYTKFMTFQLFSSFLVFKDEHILHWVRCKCLSLIDCLASILLYILLFVHVIYLVCFHLMLCLIDVRGKVV